MSSSNIETSPAENEVQVILFLHHTYGGAGKNQVDVARAQDGDSNSFGAVAVNDWQLTGSLDPNGQVIARAQGMHFLADRNSQPSGWFNILAIAFQGDRFKENSTLIAAGLNVTEGLWAIIGGTGEFTNARGTISKEKVENNNGVGDIMKITIKATYNPSA
ncbi:hypothetical protein LUZ61_012811 [Rhynchospora tenuis]|uniref:Dirigent protein n=1 Tax=Rhynchospora tenuis TaxID=198213 RepID=A0AAD6F1L2_9POAL|nr:hypothetical protein LUZ61_012808 [Rhynchospora tenuis]KAJ3709104.1 hypothetical protein LUZ61_012809 [Rhynchospora tenuis]KAJ3709105.1 hypothetical protein LUZ61_012810 [Rhynchospora tenuis]KAJ3709106.1 hypothetical protein LUZ61_012811 [Rhynchospora tenuis]